MLPFIQVRHIPSASSFYSAVTQPLGLRYISSAATPDRSLASSPPSITFGTATNPPVPVFQVRQATPVAGQPLQLLHVVLTAPSPEAVKDFEAFGQRAKQDPTSANSWEIGGPQFQSPSQSLLPLRQSPELDDSRGGRGSTFDSGERRAKITDLEGNIMEVVYVPPLDYSSQYSGSTLRKTQSTRDEVSRILHWNYDVASTDTPGTALSIAAEARHPGRFPDDGPHSIIRRSVTTHSTTILSEPTTTATPPTPPTPSSNLGVVSAFLGVAAGAAIGAGITYGVMKNERMPNPFEAPPMSQRRSTFPEPYPDQHSRYADPQQRSVKAIEYPDGYTAVASRHPPPTVMTRYSQATVPRCRDDDDAYDDGRSRHSSRYRASRAGGASVRPRSEISASRKPLMLTDAEHRSYVSSSYKHSDRTSEIDDKHDRGSYASSRRSSKSKSQLQSQYTNAPPPSMRRSSTFDVADRDSYVSARSHRSSSTIRGPPAPSAQTVLSQNTPSQLALRPASKPPSRVSTTTITTFKVPSIQTQPQSQTDSQRSSRSWAQSYMSTREPSILPSRAASYRSTREVALPARRAGTSRVSARNLGLPASGAGSSHAGWDDDDDDGDSIAPSDSISCVGSRQSARLHH